MIDYTQSTRYFEYVNRELDLNYEPPKAKVLSIIDGDDILGVTLFNRLATYNCELSIVSSSPKWATKAYLREVFSYAFIQCGYRRVTAVTQPDNVRTQRMLKRLGFSFEGRMRKWYDDGKDGLMFGMLSTECRWLRENTH